MTADEILIDRALRAGWTWHVDRTEWPGSEKYPTTGWLCREGSFSSTDNATKKASMLAKNPGEGFDHPHECCECGKPIWLGYTINAELVKRKECFTCNHWMGLVRSKNNIVIARDNGTRSHYQAGGENDGGPAQWRGFGGDRFAIRFLADGCIQRTNNLWHQGTVPERFYDRLPINAEFIKEPA